jgi:hypothetical protein
MVSRAIISKVRDGLNMRYKGGLAATCDGSAPRSVPVDKTYNYELKSPYLGSIILGILE